LLKAQLICFEGIIRLRVLFDARGTFRENFMNKMLDLNGRRFDEINYIERRFKDFWIADVPLRSQALTFMQHTNEMRKLKSYVERAEGGAHVFEISSPTQPVVTSAAPKTNLIVALSIVLGGFFGAAYVLLRNAIRRRRETLSASSAS